MEFELIHFPNFQNSFFGKEYCSSILETFNNVRKRLSCGHITHIAPKNSETQSSEGNMRLVVTTVPEDWVVTYAAKSYFDVDPLFHPKNSDVKNGRSVNIVEVYQAKQNTQALQNFVDDMRAHKFADHYILVTQPMGRLGDAHTIFTFDNPKKQNGLNAEELIRLLEKDLLQAANEIHEVVNATLSDHTTQKKEVQSLVTLTPREVDCLKWAARGKTDGEIAEILSIARWTVVTYLQNAKIKLGCANRTSAVAVAMSLGVIPMPDTSHLQA